MSASGAPPPEAPPAWTLAGRDHRLTLTHAAELVEAAYWDHEHADGLPYVALGSWLRSVARRHRCAPGGTCVGCASPWPCADLLSARWTADTLLGFIPDSFAARYISPSPESPRKGSTQ